VSLCIWFRPLGRDIHPHQGKCTSHSNIRQNMVPRSSDRNKLSCTILGSLLRHRISPFLRRMGNHRQCRMHNMVANSRHSKILRWIRRSKSLCNSQGSLQRRHISLHLAHTDSLRQSSLHNTLLRSSRNNIPDLQYSIRSCNTLRVIVGHASVRVNSETTNQAYECQ